MVGPGAGGHHLSIDDRTGIDEFRARRLDIWRERRIRGGLSALQDPGGSQGKWGMTQLGHRLLLLKEMPDDLLQVGVVADVFGGPPTWDHKGNIVIRLHVFEGEIRVPTVSRLLGIRVVPRLEVVDHEMELLLARCGDLHVVALFLQALIGVEDFQRLRRVAGD